MAEAMKLGFLLFDYFPYGGLQRDCLRTATLAAQRGHQVTILTRTWQGPRPDEVQVQLFGRRGWSNVARNQHWLQQLAAFLPALKLDGVAGFNKLPGLDAYFGSDPCYAAKVARLKGGWYRWLPRYRHFAGLERAVFAQRQPTHILLLTGHEIPVYRQWYGTETERFHLLPPGIIRRDFSVAERLARREQVRAAHGIAPEDRLLLFVGSGFRVKGLDRALMAVAALPPAVRDRVQLMIVGENRPGRFAWLARRLGIGERVKFLGGRPDVYDWLLAGDLLVHPAYSESAGMVLLEALTAGLPVLTTDTCGYAFHVNRAQAGVVLPSPFRQEQCNLALQTMLTAPESSAWRANGLAYAAQEDLYSCHARAVELIEATVESRLGARSR